MLLNNDLDLLMIGQVAAHLLRVVQLGLADLIHDQTRSDDLQTAEDQHYHCVTGLPDSAPRG